MKTTGHFKRLRDIEEQGFSEKGKFKCLYDEPLTKTSYGARIPVDIAKMIDKLPNKSAWIREKLIAAAKAELMAEN